MPIIRMICCPFCSKQIDRSLLNNQCFECNIEVVDRFVGRPHVRLYDKNYWGYFYFEQGELNIHLMDIGEENGFVVGDDVISVLSCPPMATVEDLRAFIDKTIKMKAWM